MNQKVWKDVAVGDVFPDGSKVTAIHPSYISECYKVTVRKTNANNLNFLHFGKKEVQETVLSSDHLLLIDISSVEYGLQESMREALDGWGIPNVMDRHLEYQNLDDVLKPVMTKREISQILEAAGVVGVFDHNNHNAYKTGQPLGVDPDNVDNINIPNHLRPLHVHDEVIGPLDPVKFDGNQYWIPVAAIFALINFNHQKLYCNGNLILSVEYAGKHEVRCVSTDTHFFSGNGLIHHNSVTLRNIIMHCLTHSDSISIALVDLKLTEFSYYKGMKGVVAVANTVQETVEILRLMRECMYQRNREMAKLGINDIKDFKPQKPTDEFMIFNHRMKADDMVEIRNINGEIKSVRVDELERYMD